MAKKRTARRAVSGSGGYVIRSAEGGRSSRTSKISSKISRSTRISGLKRSQKRQ